MLSFFLKGIHKSLQNKIPHSSKLLLLSNTITTNIHAQNNHENHITQQEIESWVSLISTLAEGGPNRELALFESSKLLSSGAKPNGYDLALLVRVSTDLGFSFYCQQIQSFILKSGFGSNLFVSNALLKFYRLVGSMNDAHKGFVEMPERNVISWNSLISGFVRAGKFSKALGLFLELQRSDVCADAYSFTVALSASGQLAMLHVGRSIHSNIVRYGMECSNVVANCLIDMYGKCGSVQEAIWVFSELIDKDIISWNSVIAASARNGRVGLAYNIFNRMPEPDTISYNEMINGIAQFGYIEDAVEVLSYMPNPNSSSWNSIITGYVNRNRALEALEFSAMMHSSDTEMDEYTYSILLSGIANLAALSWGMLIHCCTIKCGLDVSLVVGSAQIDMYCKCGQVKNADLVFRSLTKRNLVTWNAMISGWAHNGDSSKVMQLFEEIKVVKDLKPDWVTFLNVIAACSNTNVPMQKAITYFESMINDYGIEPTVEHCCSMIRFMGQKGEVRQAMSMIHKLAFASHVVVWRALLGACGVCRDLKVAKIAAAKLIELEGDDDYVYVSMSNIFAYHGKWEEVSKVRKVMSSRGVRKEVGYSWMAA